MSSKTTRITQDRVLPALASLAVAALTVTGLGAQTAGYRADRELNFHSLRERGDIKFLPAPLQDRLVELVRRPHSYLPLTAFSEAAEPSRLFGYYLLDTTTIPPNVFTSIVPGVNDKGVIPTGANFANGGLGPCRWCSPPCVPRFRKMPTSGEPAVWSLTVMASAIGPATFDRRIRLTPRLHRHLSSVFASSRRLILNAPWGTTTLNVRTACALTTSTVVNAVVNA